MKARLLLLVLLSAVISAAYLLFVQGLMPLNWPDAIRLYALPAAACVLLGVALGVWRGRSTVVKIFVVLVCLVVPPITDISIVIAACLSDRNQCI
jgi:uncharacterized membrane protein YfcA